MARVRKNAKRNWLALTLLCFGGSVAQAVVLECRPTTRFQCFNDDRPCLRNLPLEPWILIDTEPPTYSRCSPAGCSPLELKGELTNGIFWFTGGARKINFQVRLNTLNFVEVEGMLGPEPITRMSKSYT